MLLGALSWIVRVLVVPLFGGTTGMHQALGLANTMGQGAYVTLELAYATFGMFDLTLVAIAIGLSLLAFMLDMILRIYLFIKSLIPVIG